MAALVQDLARYRATRIKAETEADALIGIAVFCGAGLVMSLICVACGLDLGTSFF